MLKPKSNKHRHTVTAHNNVYRVIFRQTKNRKTNLLFTTSKSDAIFLQFYKNKVLQLKYSLRGIDVFQCTLKIMITGEF